MQKRISLFQRKVFLAAVLFLLFAGFTVKSQVTVNGKVTSSTGPIIGANVIIQGTTQGTITDVDGQYTLSVPSENAILVFSYVGYETQIVPLQGRSKIDVDLIEDIMSIKELVVIGYGAIKKSDLTGSVASVSGEELSKMPVLNVGQALQGRAAGVQITNNSGSPGSPLRITVRGIGTVGNAEPLYVVDGVPVGNLGFLNPNDIESLEVLKDASAAAIYGARAANGVVMVTTKNGKSSPRTQVSYSAYYGIQNPIKRYDVCNAMELAELHLEAFPENQKKRSPFYEKVYDETTGTFDYAKLGVGTDWQSAIFRENAPLQNHYLSISGGQESSNYLLSFGYFEQDGIVKTTGIRRYTVKISSDHKMFKWLNMGLNTGLTTGERKAQRENDKDGPITQAMLMDPSVPVYDERDDFIWATSPIGFNPVASMAVNNNDGVHNGTQFFGNAYALISLLRGLQFKATLGSNIDYFDRHVFLPVYKMDRADQIRTTSQLDQERNRLFGWSQENTLSYSNEIGKHSFTALIGYSNYYDRWSTLRGIKEKTFNDEAQFQNFDAAESVLSLNGRYFENTMTSYLSRIIYNYDDRLLFTASIRRDGSSKFGPNNKYGNFPSFSFGYKLSSHDFFKQFSFLNLIKIRAGWGAIGNNQIPSFKYTTYIVPAPFYRYVFGENINQGAAPIVAGNPDLKWESSEQTNVGMDIAFWGNKFQLNADYFIKNTRDFLLASPVPFTAGSLQYPVINAGDIQNKGLELVFLYRKMEGAFTYEIALNYTKINNKVLSLNAEDTPLTHGAYNRSSVGESLGHFYGWVMEGVFQTPEEIESHAFQHLRTVPGDVKFKNLNDDEVININDRRVIGSIFPDFTYGMNFTFGFKGVDLVAFLQGSQGNDVYNALKEQTSRGGRDNMNRENLGRWTAPGTSNTIPRIYYVDANENNRISSRFVEDASYLRVKNVQLGYTLPVIITEKIHAGRARIYVSANNLFTFTKYSGLDPEVGGDNLYYASQDRLVMGVDRGNYPQARAFLFGIELNF